MVTTAAVARVNRGIDDRVQEIQRVARLITAARRRQGANYLIIGSDTRAFVDNPRATRRRSASDDDTEGSNSDTLMVAHVEPGAQRRSWCRFPRDLMVDVPGLPGKNQINAAYGDRRPASWSSTR